MAAIINTQLPRYINIIDVKYYSRHKKVVKWWKDFLLHFTTLETYRDIPYVQTVINL